MPKKNKGAFVSYRKDRDWWGVLEYVNGNRKWLSTGHRTEEEAREALIDILVEKKRGLYEFREVTVGKVLGYYLDNHIPHTASPEKARIYHKIVSPFWAGLKVTDVDKATCQRYCKLRSKQFREKRGKDMSNASLRREIEHVTASLNYAHDNNLIKDVPKMWKPARARARQRWLTRHEAAILLNESRKSPADYLPLAILIGLYAGARIGAILKLKWKHVDLNTETIDFRFAQTSRNKGYALVPIPRKLMTFLRNRQGKPNQYVIGNGESPIKSIKTALGTACKNGKLESVTANVLRHTHASWLKQDGIASVYIAENMGHSTPEMVDRTYGHMNKAYHAVIKEAKWGK